MCEAPGDSALMASTHSATILSAKMNLAITIVGFSLSALFMFIFCGRLLCSRFRHANTMDMLASGRRSLGSSSGERSVQGLEPSTVATFPTIKYSEQVFTSAEDNLCTICLGDFKEKDVLRVLPRCGHAFHVGCVDVWLRQHSSCPVCRISLRIFSQWRRTSNPLISLSAKSRFLPGALPDTLFEQPREFESKPIVVPTGLSKERSGHPMAYESMLVGNRTDKEVAESSLSSRLDTPELSEDISIGDKEKLLTLQPSLVPVSNSSTQTIITIENIPVEHRTPALLWDEFLASASTRQGSISPQSGMPVCRSETGRIQEDPSFCQTGSSDGGKRA